MKVGIIGAGNMGSAILKGIAHDYEVYVYDIDEAKINSLTKVCTFKVCSSEEEVIDSCSYIILAVKPGKIKEVVNRISSGLNGTKCLISIAAGVGLNDIKRWSKKSCPVVRIMPNTPAIVKKGVFAVCFDDNMVTQEHKSNIMKMFGLLGKVYEIGEKGFDAFTALVGCGPAYFYYFLEALIEAGITVGFPKDISKDFIFDLVEGSLKLARETSLPISELRHMITSPGGATIYALNHLDRKSTKANMVDAVLAAFTRCKELGNS